MGSQGLHGWNGYYPPWVQCKLTPLPNVLVRLFHLFQFPFSHTLFSPFFSKFPPDIQA